MRSRGHRWIASIYAIAAEATCMPKPKSDFDALYPCDFYTPAELLDADQMYTVYEIARLLQGLDPDAAIDEGVEDVLLDWAIPWVMQHADELVIAEPPTDEEPGYYGLKTNADADTDGGAGANTNADSDADTDGDIDANTDGDE